uniref:CCT-theta n=1 Tax=Odontella aurita TaxID=265563 RepID=A0A7S4JV19_9STRA
MTSMALNSAAGLSGMLKDGHRHFEGVEGAVLRNVEAAKDLSRIIASSLGPNGMNKLVVNHLGRIIVTSDCAAIVRELEIEHPAARMLSMASETQDKECGDGTNLTVSFAGELLTNTEDLIRMGLHPSEIVAGYRAAGEKLMEILPTLTCSEMADGRSKEELIRVVTPVLAAKQHGSESILAPLVADACLGVVNRKGKATINPESVRVAKILGGSVGQSKVIHGFVALRGVETTVKFADAAKVCVFGCGIEASTTEAKGTVLMKDADDLKGYNLTEEKKMEEIIKSISDAGTKVVVSGGSISEMAMHFIERYGMMCMKIGSKWELRRLCSAVNATALVRLGPPTPDEMGYADSVKVQEVGGRRITVFSQSEESAKDGCRLSTILLRASTSNLLQDLERAVDDGVHAAKTACRDARLVPGAGAVEMELSTQIRTFADSRPGLDQYAIRAFASCLEFVPRTLAQNAGLDAQAVVAALGAAHANGDAKAGVDIEAADGKGSGVCECRALDLLAAKTSAFQLAIDAALTVLRVDQIIMAKQAGGGMKNATMGQT